MQLNIYLLTHPFIQILSNHIVEKEEHNNFIYYLKSQQLGTFLIYEAVRKWISLKNIYIKKINYIQQLKVHYPLESYLIISDLTTSHSIITNAAKLFPYIQFKDISNIYEQVNYRKNEKSFFFEKSLCNYNTIKSIDYLIQYRGINVNQMKVACIICNNKVLNLIGESYPGLEIYTTKIINF
uniref:Uracil phosphoribosyltransferase or UMP pyrophosphorylase n=1 Tax=Gelidium elegans TaxID=37200 RepID=A0A141SDN6_GELEL|nr:uracil phosphoribosyltransferase or UMP pyrophosphorylase [Gelidium elegans]AMK96404.1 uracil phosphoribosyltransferase or UMP pyrophosphorylase [Gelidium elegans]